MERGGHGGDGGYYGGGAGGAAGGGSSYVIPAGIFKDNVQGDPRCNGNGVVFISVAETTAPSPMPTWSMSPTSVPSTPTPTMIPTPRPTAPTPSPTVLQK